MLYCKLYSVKPLFSLYGIKALAYFLSHLHLLPPHLLQQDHRRRPFRQLHARLMKIMFYE